VYTGTFPGLLNPYALLTGALSVGLFALHGSLYLCTKVDGEPRQRLARWATGLWLAVVLLVLAVLAASAGSARHLFAGAGAKPALGLLLLALLGGLAYLPVGVKTQRFKAAFAASGTVIAALLGGLGVLLFPRTLPSTLAPAGSLTVADSSSPTTLGAMLGLAAVGVPLIVGYTAVVYRTFRGRPVPHDDGY
jgi:cytochrome d ubiquinol oxidase subunit II